MSRQRDERVRRRAVAGAIGGAVLALAAWAVIVPWDLSEVDGDGRAIAGRGDGAWPAIAAVLVVVVLAALVLVGTGRRSAGVAAVMTGAPAWVVLFAWRVSGARTSGANMWIAGLVVAVVPAALAAVALVAFLASREPER